jgi:hypothetical protein
MLMNQARQTAVDLAQDKRRRLTGMRLPLDIGLRMALEFGPLQATENSQQRIAAELIGVVHFEFLILRLPWVPGLKQRLVPHTGMTVRFVAEGELCGFQAEILSHAVKPALMLFLAYPEVIERLPLRQHKRLQCALPVQVRSRRGDSDAIIADLSRGGCRLALNVMGQASLRQMVVGDQLVLTGAFSADGRPQAVTCTVRSVDLAPNRLVLGVAFTEGDKSFWDSLDSFLMCSELLDN